MLAHSCVENHYGYFTLRPVLKDRTTVTKNTIILHDILQNM